MVRIAVIAEYNPKSETHLATTEALKHSSGALGVAVECDWISSSDVTRALFDDFDALWIGIGGPYKDLEKVLWAIRYAREHRVPTLGTCGGFQHIMIEIARNVLGVEDAAHAEYDPSSSRIFISRLSCSLAGREMNLKVVPGSQVHTLYGCSEIREKYYCNFGVSPEYVEMVKLSSVSVVGVDGAGEIRIIEIPGHPFFIATLFVPQAQSTPEDPHPLINGFVSAANRGERSVCRPVVKRVAAEAQNLLEQSQRSVLAVCGLGGTGKSTCCHAVAERFGEQAVVFETDWFLAHATTERRGLIQKALESGNRDLIQHWENPSLWYNWAALRDGLLTLRDAGVMELSDAWSQVSGERDLEVRLSLPEDKAAVILCDGIYLLHPEIRSSLDRVVLLEGSVERAVRQTESRDAHRSPQDYLDFKADLLERYDKPYFLHFRDRADVIIDIENE